MKKITILLGATILILSLLDYFGLIGKKYCSVTCLQNFDGLGFGWFLVLTTTFIFSLLTTFISQKLNVVWWKFARIGLPATLIISTIINMRFHHKNFGVFNMDGAFDLMILFVVYAIFVMGSIIQIWRGYRSR